MEPACTAVHPTCGESHIHSSVQWLSDTRRNRVCLPVKSYLCWSASSAPSRTSQHQVGVRECCQPDEQPEVATGNECSEKHSTVDMAVTGTMAKHSK